MYKRIEKEVREGCLFVDFEFSGGNKRFVDLICMSCQILNKGAPIQVSLDLRSEENKEIARQFFKDSIDLTFVAYGLSAELRALFSLFKTEDLDSIPVINYVCLHAEHRLLANKHKDLHTGDMVVDGKVKNIPFHPKKIAGFDHMNLLNALLKISNHVDVEHIAAKNDMRDICIRGWDREIEKNIKSITDYCDMDTEQLPKLLENMLELHEERGGDLFQVVYQMLERGKYVACTSEAEQRGYHIDMKKFKNLQKNCPQIMFTIIEHIIAQFPRYNTFSWNDSTNSYTFHVDEVIQYIKEEYPADFVRVFPRTKKTNKLSVSKDVLEELYGHIKHSLNDNDYLQQIFKFLYTRSALSGVVRRQETAKTRSMVQYMEEGTGVVHPYLNPFGSQTGRSQPPANGFILGKPAWMRILLSHPQDKALIAMDCGKQEVLQWGITSKDAKLIEAYRSGDPYVSFGLDCGILRKDMEKSEWDSKRHACKTIVLMIFFGAGAQALKHKLSLALGKTVQQYEAARYIRMFEENYPGFRRFRERTPTQYRKDKKLKLKDGWTLWEHNYNPRSVVNFPIQGGCAEVMRKAVIVARNQGVVCNMTQHDSFMTYVDYNDGVLDWEPITTLARSIRYAFRCCNNWAEGSDLITLDLKIIQKNIKKMKNKLDYLVVDGEYSIDDISYTDAYRDPRAKADLEQYGKYLEE